MSKTAGDETLGRGVAFPLQLANGEVGMKEFESQVEQSIRLILATAQGERVMRPDFGAGMETLTFEPMNTVTVAVLQHRLNDTLTQFEPRIELLDVLVSAMQNEGELHAEIRYRLKRTNSVFNLVYPF